MVVAWADGWEYWISGIVWISKENERAVKNTLDELKENGYLKVTKLLPNQTSTGRIEYIYDIFENKKQEVGKQGVENLGVEKQGLENQGLENQGQLNTNILITNKLNTNKLNIDKKNKPFTKPEIEEIQKYCLERNNGINAETFYDFYESKGWYVGKNKMKDWKACIRTWENRQIKKIQKQDDEFTQVLKGVFDGTIQLEQNNSSTEDSVSLLL